jgi:hypothetical protein
MAPVNDPDGLLATSTKACGQQGRLVRVVPSATPMTRIPLRRLSIALPVVFAFHVFEEAPGFVSWFNSLVTPNISQRLFLLVNAAAFAITLLVALTVVVSPHPASGLLGVAWVGFLMLANGLFHIVATVVHGRYCPGAVTGALLYLPVSALFIGAVVRDLGVPPLAAAAVALLGGVPMYVHGYLIVFRGSRLF